VVVSTRVGGVPEVCSMQQQQSAPFLVFFSAITQHPQLTLRRCSCGRSSSVRNCLKQNSPVPERGFRNCTPATLQRKTSSLAMLCRGSYLQQVFAADPTLSCCTPVHTNCIAHSPDSSAAHARYYAGVAQVLPPDVMLLAEPSPEDLLAAVEAALTQLPHLDPQQQHQRVSRKCDVLLCE
jgi:hypothetical protein